MADVHNIDYDTSIMVAIKCQDDKAGERGARPAWVWETWQNEFSFRPENEFWGERFDIMHVDKYQPSHRMSTAFLDITA